MALSPRKHNLPATGGTTRQALTAAAASEFNTHGYYGTDTNRIARSAGFAPQTFYRHFKDKLDVFLAVYEHWRDSEAAVLAGVLKATPAADRPAAAAQIIIRHHRDWAVFRRSLRLLAVEETRVRTARAGGRAAQTDALAALDTNAGRSRAAIAAAILTIERLCDAMADTEHADLDIPDADWTRQIEIAVAAARGEPAAYFR